MAYALVVDTAGNVYVTGRSTGGDQDDMFHLLQYGVDVLDYATVKYDSNGSQLWVARYDGDDLSTLYDDKDDRARDIAIDAFGNVYVTGSRNGDYATLKYDANGSQVWEARYNVTGSGMDRADAIAMDGVGNVYVAGRSLGLASSYDYATIKYIPDTDDDTISDFWEMTFFGDLLTANETTDYDNDGLPDKFESAHNTDPRNPDSDDDGLPDGYEIANHLDPLDNGSIDPSNGSDGDPDNDYYKNRDEYLAGEERKGTGYFKDFTFKVACPLSLPSDRNFDASTFIIMS